MSIFYFHIYSMLKNYVHSILLKTSTQRMFLSVDSHFIYLFKRGQCILINISSRHQFKYVGVSTRDHFYP